MRLSHHKPRKYTVTLVPTVGMFDAAIEAADASGDLDEARTCAVGKLEQAKSLPYETVTAGLDDGSCEPSGLEYKMVTRPVDVDLGSGSGGEGLTMVTVTVESGGGSYSVSGVVSRW